MGAWWLLVSAVLLQAGGRAGAGAGAGGGNGPVVARWDGVGVGAEPAAFASPGEARSGNNRIRHALMSETNLTKAMEELRSTSSLRNFVKTRNVQAVSDRLDRGMKHKIVSFSGGSAFGELSSALANSSKSVDYVVPVTDNGGSSGEIRRVFGGSAVGDIRSRLMHVAPIEKSCYHLRNMLQTRLDPYNESKAMFQMKEFCSAHADDWKSMTENERIILVLLSIFIKMATAYDSTNSSDVWFQFRSSNFGNLVLHSLKFVLGGLEEAIRWFSFALLVPETTRVFPCTLDLEQSSDEQTTFLTQLTNGDFRGHWPAGIELGAELEDGQIILGQDEISHPPVEEGGSPPPLRWKRLRRVLSVDKNLFGGSDRAPPSKICKMFYSLSTTGERIKPSANLNILPVLETAELILYGPGSLFTSVMPSLILPGMGEAVASSKAQKLLLLNGNSDRESGNMTALEFAQAIASGFNRYGECEHDLSAYLNYV